MSTTLTFGAFAFEALELENVDAQLYQKTAEIYAYRFSKEIHKEALNESIEQLYSSMKHAHSLNGDLCKRTTFFTFIIRQLESASHAYFGCNWDDLHRTYEINRPAYVELVHGLTTHQAEEYSLPPSSTTSDQSHKFEIETYTGLACVMQKYKRVLVFFTADYCRFCRLLEPALTEVAEKMAAVNVQGKKELAIATVFGPQHIDIRDKYKIKLYPSLLLFVNDELCAEYPRDAPRTAEAIFEFCRTTEPSSSGSGMSTDESVANSTESGSALEGTNTTRARSLDSWKDALIASGIDLIDELERDRTQRWKAEKENALRNAKLSVLDNQNAEELESQRKASLGIGEKQEGGKQHEEEEQEQEQDPPTIFFTGGGIASGKSTALGLLYESKFWAKHAKEVVHVEADAIKMTDPLFKALKGVGAEGASKVVHHSSVSEAENLLVGAVNHRLHIVFDSTMMWRPFVEQTLAMVRDDGHDYTKGPGYLKDEDGNVTEQYWLKTGRCQALKKPYRVVLLGVTIDPAIAVERAMLRWITTTRGDYEVKRILLSHKWFSDHFTRYADVFDEIVLVDKNPSTDDQDQKSQPQPSSDGTTPLFYIHSLQQAECFRRRRPATIIALKPSKAKPLEVLDQAAMNRFLDKRNLNDEATSRAALY